MFKPSSLWCFVVKSQTKIPVKNCSTMTLALNMFPLFSLIFIPESFLIHWGDVRNTSNGRFRREKTYAYLWLILVDVWQTAAQYCRAIILQLNIKALNKTTKKRNTSYKVEGQKA